MYQKCGVIFVKFCIRILYQKLCGMGFVKFDLAIMYQKYVASFIKFSVRVL